MNDKLKRQMRGGYHGKRTVKDGDDNVIKAGHRLGSAVVEKVTDTHVHLRLINGTKIRGSEQFTLTRNEFTCSAWRRDVPERPAKTK